MYFPGEDKIRGWSKRVRMLQIFGDWETDRSEGKMFTLCMCKTAGRSKLHLGMYAYVKEFTILIQNYQPWKWASTANQIPLVYKLKSHELPCTFKSCRRWLPNSTESNTNSQTLWNRARKPWLLILQLVWQTDCSLQIFGLYKTCRIATVLTKCKSL